MSKSRVVRRFGAILLLAVAVSAMTACSRVNTRVVSAPGASSQRGGVIYRFFNPEYARNWPWWKKAMFWIGPGH